MQPWCPALLVHLAERCASGESGARLIDQLLEQSLLPGIADRLLDAMASGEPITRVHATLDGEGALACEFT